MRLSRRSRSWSALCLCLLAGSYHLSCGLDKTGSRYTLEEVSELMQLSFPEDIRRDQFKFFKYSRYGAPDYYCYLTMSLTPGSLRNLLEYNNFPDLHEDTGEYVQRSLSMDNIADWWRPNELTHCYALQHSTARRSYQLLVGEDPTGKRVIFLMSFTR